MNVMEKMEKEGEALPLVSVVVGVYNKERYVGETLRSVRAQTYPHWELLVVDDASTDGSLKEVERALEGERRAQVLRMERNSGHPGVARNRGIREARGKYVAFLDADDVWKPGKLDLQVRFMEENPEVDISHTRCEVIDGAGKSRGLRHGETLPEGEEVLAALLRHCFICTSTVMVRREFGATTGWFSEEACFHSGQDYEFFVRCARDGQVGLVNEVLTLYRQFEGTVSRNTRNWRARPSDFVRKKLFLAREDLWSSALPVGEMRRIVWEAAEENAQYWRAKGEWGKALWFTWEMVKLRPWTMRTWWQVGGTSLRRR